MLRLRPLELVDELPEPLEPALVLLVRILRVVVRLRAFAAVRALGVPVVAEPPRRAALQARHLGPKMTDAFGELLDFRAFRGGEECFTLVNADLAAET